MKTNLKLHDQRLLFLGFIKYQITDEIIVTINAPAAAPIINGFFTGNEGTW